MKSNISHGTDATIRSMIQSTKTSPGKNKSQKQQIPLQEQSSNKAETWRAWQ